jgi:acylphosphatase
MSHLLKRAVNGRPVRGATRRAASRLAGPARSRGNPPGGVPSGGAGPFAEATRQAAYRLLVVRYRVLISGQVQGVFFRDTCRRLAVQHGVTGWVRNLPDGRVEAVFEGPAQDVGRLLDWAHHGPRLAVVDGVAVQTERPEGLAAFHIK